MAMQTEEVEYHKGDKIIDEKDDDRSMFIIKTGHVEVTKNNGIEVTQLATLGPGEYFGEMAFFDDKPRSANVVAIEETKVVKLQYSEEMVKALNNLPSWIITILGGVFRRLRNTNAEVEKTAEEEGLNYQELKTKHLSKSQFKELWRVLSLTDLIISKYGLRKSNRTYVDLHKLRRSYKQFFPNLSLGVDNIIELFHKASIRSDTPMCKDSPLYRVYSHSKITKFSDYIKGAVRVDFKKLQVSPSDANFIEAVLISMKERIKGKHLNRDGQEFKELQMTIDVKKVTQILSEKFQDGNTMYYLDGMHEKRLVEKKSISKLESTYSCFPDELDRSLPYLRLIGSLTNIIIKNKPK
jgi:CRP-like cAMP-binding protein